MGALISVPFAQYSLSRSWSVMLVFDCRWNDGRMGQYGHWRQGGRERRLYGRQWRHRTVYEYTLFISSMYNAAKVLVRAHEYTLSVCVSLGWRHNRDNKAGHRCSSDERER